VAQERVFPTERLATHAVRLVLLVLGFVVAPKVMLAGKAQATQVTMNINWRVDENALLGDQYFH
jgi:hypothetical protein